MNVRGIFQKNQRWIIGVVIGLIIAFFVGSYFVKSQEVPEGWEEHLESEVVEVSDSTSEQMNQIFVDIKGEIRVPGVYKMDPESRMHDLIQKAGGFTKNAQEKKINLAEKLVDQQMVYVPNQNEVIENEIEEIEATQKSELININTADLLELQQLNGIGPAKAQAIVDYREENGFFKSVDELDKVPGFGLKTVEKLRNSIRI